MKLSKLLVAGFFALCVIGNSYAAGVLAIPMPQLDQQQIDQLPQTPHTSFTGASLTVITICGTINRFIGVDQYHNKFQISMEDTLNDQESLAKVVSVLMFMQQHELPKATFELSTMFGMQCL